MNIFYTKNLNWKYDKTDVLKGINVSLGKGKIHSIIGPNGSGKTTLLKNMVKIFNPEKDSVFYDDKDIRDYRHKELARHLAYVPQGINGTAGFTVKDVVLMGRSPFLKRFQSESEADYELAERSMEITNTIELKDRKIDELSGGERQRVIIARALTQSPEVLFLDEPLSNLDLHHQIEIMDLLRYLNKEKKLTVVIVVHDLNIALRYSDDIILLDNGKVVDSGGVEEVLRGEKIKEVYKMKFSIINDNGNPYIVPEINQFKFE